MTVLNPWEELAQVDRPSIFLKDPYFRVKNPSNQIKKEEDLGSGMVFAKSSMSRKRISSLSERTLISPECPSANRISSSSVKLS